MTMNYKTPDDAFLSGRTAMMGLEKIIKCKDVSLKTKIKIIHTIKSLKEATSLSLQELKRAVEERTN